jgi:predicted metal-dependent phosphoesterase TrpH
MYKTELHVHSAEVSNCATVDCATIARRYITAGYTTLVLTNHLSRFTYKNKKFDRSSDPWEVKIDFYMAGYKKFVEAAAGRLNVLFSVELRSNRDENDYLIYGIDDKFLYSMPQIMDMKVSEVADAVRSYGGLFFQAHPFRNSMRITKPDILDGIEVYNGHIGHDSRNDIANLWADKFGFIKISGSDYHHDTSVIGAGILTAEPVTNVTQLVSILKSGRYALIRSGAVPY